MKPYTQLSKEELKALKNDLEKQFKEIKKKGLKLDMSRGKPSKAQLDLSNGMMDVLTSDSDLVSSDGVDCRNYGVMEGISEARKLLADMSEVPERNILIYGNSSLSVMFDTVSRAMTHGIMGNTPWGKLDKVKFLCPVPGYDRHFAITEYFGIEMVNVPLLPTGPDMDMVEKLVSQDASIKGIWCVPKYSNPDGYIYSNETVERFAALKPAAPDFTIMWDNAYGVHEFSGDYVPFLDIIEACSRHGNPDMVMEFASTSKITFAGGGISAMAMSEANVAYFSKLLSVQTICYDKVNQLRHVRFLKDKAHTLEIMKKHAAILAPKFRKVGEVLTRELADCGFAHWTEPKGGYFVSLYTMPGTAKRALELCQEAGVVMTPAGATYPCGVDPQDSNIRIAPSYPPVEELEKAMYVFCICLKLAALEKIMGMY